MEPFDVHRVSGHDFGHGLGQPRVDALRFRPASQDGRRVFRDRIRHRFLLLLPFGRTGSVLLLLLERIRAPPSMIILGRRRRRRRRHGGHDGRRFSPLLEFRVCCARARLCVVCVSKARVLSLVQHTAFLPKTFLFFLFFFFFFFEKKRRKNFKFYFYFWEEEEKKKGKKKEEKKSKIFLSSFR